LTTHTDFELQPSYTQITTPSTDVHEMGIGEWL